MQFHINQSVEVLERTPMVLEHLLKGISDEWVMSNEGQDTFSPFDVLGHLIHGEKTDWIPRLELILSHQPDKTFTPYDRFAQYEASKGKNLNQLLEEFKQWRQHNIKLLQSKQLTENDYLKTGIHPKFGTVTLAQLIATWTVHDLGHIAQITRVMSKQYKTEVGPWINYLGILSRY